jgi:hypothetical protein
MQSRLITTSLDGKCTTAARRLYGSFSARVITEYVMAKLYNRNHMTDFPGPGDIGSNS